MSLAVGIDLGTTFSVISVFKDDKVEIIPNEYGNRTTPSIVAFDNENNVFVGESAIDMANTLPEKNIISVVKRSIGSDKKYFINNLEYTPEQISSEILKYLKHCAENYLGNVVSDAVITVPAYFNNDQRQKTKLAGELAGFNVLRIINEPTAASIAYGLDKTEDKTILVYDLGGGTFDVTILKLSDGVDFHVLSTSGNTKLGGVDFDRIITKIALSKFKNSYFDKFQEEIDIDFSEDEINKLNESSEKVKKALSISKKAFFSNSVFSSKNLKFLNINESISREDFENGISGLVLETKNCIDQAINDSSLKFDDIDEIVFVGGSTRIPYISEKIEEWSGKKPNKSINPDEAVSIGAAIHASVLSGSTNKEVYLIDVTPLSLGIETQGGVMNTMIKRNTSIPAEYTEIFTTAYDNQTSVDVKVFQGERPQTCNNYFLGEFTLDNIPSNRRGVPKINVVFSVDVNGIVSVKAIDEATKNEKTMILSGKTNLDIVSSLIKDAEENKISDERFRQITSYREWLTNYKIQLQELIDSKVLNSSDIKSLEDLKDSIDNDYFSENLELLHGLVQSSKELVEEMSEKVYEEAKKILR